MGKYAVAGGGPILVDEQVTDNDGQFRFDAVPVDMPLSLSGEDPNRDPPRETYFYDE
jgi:hypothetical protein